MSKLWHYLLEKLWSLQLDQRKQIANISNTIAVLLYVQYYLKLSGLPALGILLMTLSLWVFSVKIVKSGEGDNKP